MKKRQHKSVDGDGHWRERFETGLTPAWRRFVGRAERDQGSRSPRGAERRGARVSSMRPIYIRRSMLGVMRPRSQLAFEATTVIFGSGDSSSSSGGVSLGRSRAARRSRSEGASSPAFACAERSSGQTAARR